MTLKDKYEMLWTQSVEQGDPESRDVQGYLSSLLGASGACIIGLAAEIDLLRNELVSKGVLDK